MTQGSFRSGAAASILSVSLLAGYRWRSALRATDRLAPPRAAIAAVQSPTRDSTLDDELSALAAADPFRLSNTPAAVRFDARNDAASPAPGTMPAAALRPALILRAIVGGPPWQAIVDGIPGQQPGTVVRAGSAFDRISVAAVTRDSVVLHGPDTTWVLAFRRSP